MEYKNHISTITEVKNKRFEKKSSSVIFPTKKVNVVSNKKVVITKSS